MNSVKKKAIDAIEREGELLVFPIKNSRHPKSLWFELHPRSKMRWEWDQDGDTRVHDLWNLREELSRSGKVVYGKFYKGRATFYSKKKFIEVLSHLKPWEQMKSSLNPDARKILGALLENSPLPTKRLKKEIELEGKFYEPRYNRGLKELWQKHLIVGWGESAEGAFPSLNMGATALLFEDLWTLAQSHLLNKKE